MFSLQFWSIGLNKRKLNFFLVLYAILTTYIVYIKFCVETSVCSDNVKKRKKRNIIFLFIANNSFSLILKNNTDLK